MQIKNGGSTPPDSSDARDYMDYCTGFAALAQSTEPFGPNEADVS